jgi:hypothetical protein
LSVRRSPDQCDAASLAEAFGFGDLQPKLSAERRSQVAFYLEPV